MEKRDYYEVLEIEKNSSAQEIKSAYRKMAKKYHPDLNPNDKEAEGKFKEATEAYEVLSDDERRSMYDRFGHSAFSQGSNGGGGYYDFSDIDLGDIFGDFFRGGFGQNRASRPMRGSNIEKQIKITFEEAVFGVQKEVSYQKVIKCKACDGSGAKDGTSMESCKTCNGSGVVRTARQTFLGSFVSESVCPDCHGKGKRIKEKCSECQGNGVKYEKKTVKVNVPSGVDRDSIIQMEGLGNAGKNGGPAGHLLLYFDIEPHPSIIRQGETLYTEKILSFTQLCLGSTIEIETLDGVETFTVPKGTQSETVFTLKHKGVPFLKRKGRGDFKFKVKVDIPTKLTQRQAELLEEFEAEFSGTKPEVSEHKKEKTFFDKLKDGVKDTFKDMVE